MSESTVGAPAKTVPLKRAGELFRQLADLTDGGLTPAEAVALLKDDNDSPAIAAMLDSIGQDLERDPSLAKAFERHASLLGSETVALIGVAEQHNALPGGLAMLADDFDRRQQLDARLLISLSWPLFLLGFLAFVTLMMMIFVIPAFKVVFGSFGAELPGPTLFVIALSDTVADFWWIIVALVVALPFGIAWLRRRGRALDQAFLKLPGVERLLVGLLTARATALLAGAAVHRIPFEPVIAYLQSTLGNQSLKAAVAALGRDVGQGSALSAAWRKQSLLPGKVAKMMEIGERSDKLAPIMARAARIYGADAANAAAVFRQVLFVTTYILTGIIVGIVVIAMYLPIFKLGSVI